MIYCQSICISLSCTKLVIILTNANFNKIKPV